MGDPGALSCPVISFKVNGTDKTAKYSPQLFLSVPQGVSGSMLDCHSIKIPYSCGWGNGKIGSSVLMISRGLRSWIFTCVALITYPEEPVSLELLELRWLHRGQGQQSSCSSVGQPTHSTFAAMCGHKANPVKGRSQAVLRTYRGIRRKWLVKPCNT